jgi:hypothetical protein
MRHFLKNLFGGNKVKMGSPRKRKPVRLGVEMLEDRLVPTILFRPHFGAEAIAPGSQNDGMQSPPVYMTFWGPYWGTAQGRQDENALLTSAQNVINSPYFSGLKQYGSDGVVTFGASWEDLSTPTVGSGGQLSSGTLQNFLQGTIDNQSSPIPRPSTPAHAPIYVVVTDPISDAGSNGGWNAGGTYTTPIFVPNQAMHMVWVGTSFQGGQVWKDAFTLTLSHELAETISDPDSNGIRVNSPSNLPASLLSPGGNQIGDFEPEPNGGIHYGYRLNGQLVQPFWSQTDNAWLVPDTNAQTLYLNPNWNRSNYTGQNILEIDGGQLGAGSNDTVTISQTATGGVQVTLNGETTAFDAGQISGITVNTHGGTDTVNILNNAIPVSIDGATAGIGISTLVTVRDATGSVFALNCNLGNVYQQGAGSTWNQVGNGVSSLVNDATGNVFALNRADGAVFEHILGAGWNWNAVGSGISSLVSDATGNVFALNPVGGAVFEHILGTGWNWNTVGSGISSLVSDATGNVFALNPVGGVVYEHILGAGWNWNQVGSGINSFSGLVSDATGNVFALNPVSGVVYEHILGAGWNWNQVGSGINSFSGLVSDATGNVFALNPVGGAVFEHILGAAWNWNTVGSGITSLVSDATGNVFALNPVSGVVFEHIIGTGWNWNQVGSGITIFSGLVSDATGNVYALNPVAGIVYEHVLAEGWNWDQVGSDVASLVSDATGNLFALNRVDGAVFEHIEGEGWNWNTVGSDISSLVSDATGNVFALNSDAGVVFEHALGKGWNWNQVGSEATTMVADNTGTVYFLSSAADGVYRYDTVTNGWVSVYAWGIRSIGLDNTGTLEVTPY